MTKKNAGDARRGRGRGPGGQGSGLPMTQEMLAESAAAGEELAKRVLEWCQKISKAGGHPEVEWLDSMGVYRVRRGQEDEWRPFL